MMDLRQFLARVQADIEQGPSDEEIKQQRECDRIMKIVGPCCSFGRRSFPSLQLILHPHPAVIHSINQTLAFCFKLTPVYFPFSHFAKGGAAESRGQQADRLKQLSGRSHKTRASQGQSQVRCWRSFRVCCEEHAIIV